MHILHLTLVILLRPLWQLHAWIFDRAHVTFAKPRLAWWSLALCLTWLGLPGELWAHHGEAGQPGRSMRAVRLVAAPPQADGRIDRMDLCAPSLKPAVAGLSGEIARRAGDGTGRRRSR